MTTGTPHRNRQRGAALIVGLIMLVLITLTVIAGVALSHSNLKAVGNIQARNEAVAAANRAIEAVVTSLPATGPLVAPVATVSNVDINNDGTVDYVVQVAAPTCVRATKSTAVASGGSGPGGIGGGETSSTIKNGGGTGAVGIGSGGSGSGGSGSSGSSGSTCVSFCDQPDQYFSVWDITASVVDKDKTDASTTVREGVRVLLNKEQAQTFCGVT